MKSKLSLLSICICASILTGCFVKSRKFWDSEKKKIEECRSKWIYKDLSKEQQITVLLFSAKSNRDIYSYPNFLIGMTESNDTIAFLDKDFEGEIKKGDRIKLLPLQWNEAENTLEGLSASIPGDTYDLFIYVPDGFDIAKLTATVGKNKIIQVKKEMAGNALKLSFQGQPVQVKWQIQFNQALK